MKLSVAVAPDNAPDNAFVVFRGLEESIACASELGYHGIELAVGRAADAMAPQLEKWLCKYDMEISAISTGLVYAGSGISLLETPDAATALFHELIDLAAVYGKRVNIGRSRGFRGKRTIDEAAEELRRVLLPLCEHAAVRGVTLILEPVNRYEIDWINSVDDGAYVLEKMGLGQMGLMPDVFHMNIEDVTIGGKLIEHRRYVEYVHLADSNRHAPGMGHLDFSEIFGALRESGYNDWLSVEILPVPSPREAARRAAEYLLPRIARC